MFVGHRYHLTERRGEPAHGTKPNIATAVPIDTVKA
jgi:hypothetical protein